MSGRGQRLEGLSSVVTGVASGVGRAVAYELAAEGARVLGCDVNDVGGEATMDGIGLYRHADVSQEHEVEALIAAALAEFGSLDVFVNNAAVQAEKELVDTSEEDLDRLIATNVKGVFFGCKHAVLAMRQSGGGVIVNVASVLSFVADGLLAGYCATKGAVLGITRATAVQYGPSGIRCNAVCPGDIDTPLLQSYLQACDDPEARLAELTSKYPLGRVADPREIAKSVAYLASADASFVTGQTLIVDGGLLALLYR
jgi:NAD(P)-dependent dehydrogenase (short-subunit alcohol dehydrogenase family)